MLSNLETFRLRLGSGALMAVVKANAYGHGAALVAPAIREHVDWFAVDALAEAYELRALEKPILILGHTDASEAERVVELGSGKHSFAAMSRTLCPRRPESSAVRRELI